MLDQNGLELEWLKWTIQKKVLTVKENQSKLLDMLLLLYSIKKMILYFIPIRFSCDFHITQDVDSDEEIDGDSEHSHTLMSAQFEIEIDQK